VNFLQAHAAVNAFAGGPPLRFCLACSSVTATLDLFLRAHAAQAGAEAQIQTLPFNSLAQHIRTPSTGELEVFLLFPWDFVPTLDWRTGFPQVSPTPGDVRLVLAEHADWFAQRTNARFLYIPAPIPPITGTQAAAKGLAAAIEAAALELGATTLPSAHFHLGSYLQNGNPFTSASLSDIAANVVRVASARRGELKKVLITDLDNTLWAGVIGEDGPEGILHGPEGRGFPHFIYQTLLRKLKAAGVVLVAVSKNDPDLAQAPFKRGEMPLREEDMVSVVASYHSKSAQIEQLATELNLGLDSMVFVDDNPVEIAEVGRALPSVECLQFQGDPVKLPQLLERLVELFGKASVTDEDARRTQLYRLRAGSVLPSAASGADLSEFLRSLTMKLTIRERGVADSTRCLQLINKTNQFNINGRRLTEAELHSMLAQGGRLVGATLEDRNGSHGEVIACLVSPDGIIESFVMSCRVFERRAEYAFSAWLSRQPYAPRSIRYQRTERNEPVRIYLEKLRIEANDGLLPFDFGRVGPTEADALQLFDVVEPASGNP
jgi:FkbH-like protein